MKLLNVDTLTITEFREDTRPRYVIASHRWVADEVTFKDVQKKRNAGSAGYRKVQGFAKYVKEHLPFIEWLWIDTCCSTHLPDTRRHSVEVN